MELDYLDLLSPEPIDIVGIGRIRKPTAREISAIGNSLYQSYLRYFFIQPIECFNLINGNGAYEKLNNDIKNELKTFDILIEDKLRGGFLEAISFFIVGNVEWIERSNCFGVNISIVDGICECDGFISRDNFNAFANVILQISNIPTKQEEPKKFKSELARQIYEAAQKGRRARESTHGDTKSYELSNVISKLATYHNSLNMVNIWDLTVYQIYDQFTQQNLKNQNDIGTMNYSVWGGKFDPMDWFKNKNKTDN